VRGGDDDSMLLGGSRIVGTPTSWSSSSEAEGASNIGESCSEGYGASSVSGGPSRGDDCVMPLFCSQPVCSAPLSSLELEEARSLFLDSAYDCAEFEIRGCEEGPRISSDKVIDESEEFKSSGYGRFLLASFSVISGSILDKVLASHPLIDLKDAKARQSWRFLAT